MPLTRKDVYDVGCVPQSRPMKCTITRMDQAGTVLEAITTKVPDMPVFDIRASRQWNLRNALHVNWQVVRQGKLYSILPPRGENMLVAAGEQEIHDGSLTDCIQTLEVAGYVVVAALEVPTQRPNWPRAAACEEELGPPPILWRPSPVISECFPLILKIQEQRHHDPHDAPDLPSHIHATRLSLQHQSHLGSRSSDSGAVISNGDGGDGAIIPIPFCDNDSGNAGGDAGASMLMTMLDLAAGSGRDTVWPLTPASPLCQHLGCVVALEQSAAANARGADLAAMCGVEALQCDAINVPNSTRASSTTSVSLRLKHLPHSTNIQGPGAIFLSGDATNDAHVTMAANVAQQYMIQNCVRGPLDKEAPSARKQAAQVLSSTPQNHQFSIVHVARFLDRRVLPSIRNAVEPGGFILYHHFLVGSFRPKGEAKVLREGELAIEFGQKFGFTVLVDRVEYLADTRPVSIFCAQKLLKTSSPIVTPHAKT